MFDQYMQIFERIKQSGGMPYIVGGYVRDYILRLPPSDMDVEVYSLPAEKLIEVLSEFGEVNAVGASFGVLKLKYNGKDLDFSLPRRESKEGRGHTGFMEVDPTMTLQEAAARRDFTMNAMLLDPFTMEVLDFYGGRRDLECHRLVPTSKYFKDDALLASNEIHAYGVELLPEYKDLSQDRIMGEWLKWAEKSKYPSLGIEFLWDACWLGEFYPEIRRLHGVQQEHDHHPEGSVYIHTLIVVDKMVELCDRENIQGERRAVLVLAALCHDFGKYTTTAITDGKITSYNHDIVGATMAEEFLNKIGMPHHIIERVVPLVRCHLRHINVTAKAQRLANDLYPATIDDWALVVEADHSARPPLEGGLPESAQRLVEKARELSVTKTKPTPIVLGRHLLELGVGFAPGPQLGKVLRALFESQLEGKFTQLDEGILFGKAIGLIPDYVTCWSCLWVRPRTLEVCPNCGI